MKKILIIGASILQLPAIKKAKEMGYYVGVVDYNPKAIGIHFADEFFNVSTIDSKKVAETAKEFGADGIMTLATDMPMRSVARACEKCGCPGISYNTAVKATDKGEMIRAFEKHGVAHPWYYIARDKTAFVQLLCKFTYPCIMKPTDNSGSRGVVLIENEMEAMDNYKEVVKESRSGGVIIEEYMEGPEVSVEVMVIDGEPFILQITDKITTGAPHFVEMGHTQPSRLSNSTQDKIADLAKNAVKAIGINNGPAHVEIIVTKSGPKMVELGARMGGDCITTHLVPLSTGIDMVEATINLSCGKKIDIQKKISKGSAIRYFSVPNGTIKEIKGMDKAKKIPGVKEVEFAKTIGDVVTNVSNSADRVGFVIAQGDDAKEAEKICKKALRSIKIEVE